MTTLRDFAVKRGAPAAFAASLFLAIAGCSSASKDNSPPPAPAALVKTARASSGSVPLTLRLYGAADAGGSARRDLIAMAESIVLQVLAQPGTAVRRGSPIIRLKASPISQLELARARSDAAAATSALARMERLRRDGLASSGDVETAAAAARTARATLESLVVRDSGSTLLAPFDGVVTAVNASPGDLVAAGTTIASVAPARAARARFGVDPEEARLITPGHPVRIIPASSPPFTITVSALDLAVDPATRLASVYVPLPSVTNIGAGEPLVAEVQVPGQAGRVVIPYAALLDDGGQPYVFVIERSIARRRDVVLGTTTPQQAQVARGVQAGEIVVTDGGTALQDGIKVRTK